MPADIDRTTVFNNAGVVFSQAGHLDVAQDMFLAALEETLLFARETPEDDDQDEENCSPSQARRPSPTPPCVRTAENHLSNMEAILATPPASASSVYSNHSPTVEEEEEEEEEENEESSENIPPTTVPPTNHQLQHSQEAPEVVEHDENNENSTAAGSSASARPYLYQECIALQEQNISEEEEENNQNSNANAYSTNMQLTGAIVVYNLALVHHLKLASSTKARQFYEIAQALMEDGLQAMSIGMALDVHTNGTSENGDDDGGDAYRCTLLQVGITNNFGVWLYENGHLPAASACLQQLIQMMPTIGPILPLVLQQGVQSNVRRLQTSLWLSPSTTSDTKTLRHYAW